MAEVVKVRLVRCPKCENLLEEIPNVPVYKCGGCDAVLQAKKQSFNKSNGLIKKSDDGNNTVSSEKLKSSPEKREDINPSETSEVSDKESVGVELGLRDKVKIFPEKETKQTGYGDGYSHLSKDSIDNRVGRKDNEMNMGREKQISLNIEKKTGGEDEPQIGLSSSRYRREEQLPDYKLRERDRTMAYRRPRRALVDDVNFSGSSSYQDEGPSNYQKSSSSYGNGGLDNVLNNMDGSTNRVELLEEDRIELLRKLDELKEQLTRSCDVTDKSKERVPPVSCVGEVPSSSSKSNKVFSRPIPMEEQIRKPPYVSHIHDPLMYGPGGDMQGFYDARVHVSNGRQGHGLLSGPKLSERAQHQPWHHYPQRPSHGYFSGQFLDVDREAVSLYPHNNSFFHQPECVCSHCYNQDWQVSGQGPPLVYPNRRFSDPPATSRMFHHLEDPHTFGPCDCNLRSANLPLNSHEHHIRRRNAHDSEVNGFGRTRVQRVSLAKRSMRRCIPLAGGAPFIACYNCFEALTLPRKLLLRENNQQKLRCGGCSTIISVSVVNKNLVISVPTQTKEAPLEVNDSSVEVVKDGIFSSHGHRNHSSMNYSSDDYDISASNFLSMNERMNSIETEKLHGLLSSSPSTFEDEGSPNSVIARQDVSSSSELPVKASAVPPLPGSPLHEHYEPSDQFVSKFGKGNMSKRRDQEKIVFSKASRQNSVQEAMVATEMDVSLNEYLSTGTFQESKEATKEDHRPKNGKGGNNSFLVGLIKKSFKDLSKYNHNNENDGPNVFINGHPIPERFVKKAEKQAGPIRPGDYWYDSRAGFWGVMGQPCLGIIPPFIEEFSYPIPKDCSNGDTGVFVNGRELHEKDLDLLSSRGLPTASDKSYIIEMSGRILDEDSGEELESLGKLAPTVERVKRGFGMCVPEMYA